MDEWGILGQKLAAQRRQQEALDKYNAAQASLQQAQTAPTSPLETILSGAVNTIGNVGKSVGSALGGAATNNLFTVLGDAAINGKSIEQATKDASKRQDDLVKSIYGTDDTKDAYTKNLGASIDAATTAADLIPGLGTGAKVALNVGQGVVSGAVNPLAEKGSQASLEDILKGAAIGGASAGVGQAVGGNLASKAGGDTLMSKALTNNVSRGALTGAASGATGGAISAGLNGGDVLSGALQGAQGGALAGGTMAGAMGIAGKGVDKLNQKLGITQQPDVTPITTTDQDIEQVNKTNMPGRALKNVGDELQAAQTNLTRAERNKLEINDTGGAINTLRKRTGLSSVQDQADFAKNITGGPDSVMDTIQKYNLSVDDKGKPITLRQDEYEVAINDAVGQGWRKSVMGESYDNFRNDVIADIKNQDPITAANLLKADARKLRAADRRTGDPKYGEKAKILTEVANKIDDLSYSAVPQKNVNRMFDDTIDEFYTRAQEAKAAGNKKYATAYEKLAKELESTDRTIANYRTFKKDFVKSSQIADISAGARTGSMEAANKKGNVIGKTINLLLEEPTNRAMAYAGGKISDLGDIVNGANTGNVGKMAGGVGRAVGGLAGALANDTLSNITTRQIARQAGIGTDKALNNQNILQQAEQDVQGAQTEYDDAGAQMQQALNNIQTYNSQLSAGQSQLDRIAQGMDRALAAGDLQAYSQLADLYQQAYKIYGAQNTTQSAASSLNATQQSNLAKLESAGSAIDQLEQLYNQAGGGQGRFGGKLTELGASLGMNSAASSYNSAARGLINQIAAAVGKTDSLNTEGEVQRALDLVPKITDTPEEAQIKLQSLRNMLAANKQTYQNIYGVSQ